MKKQKSVWWQPQGWMTFGSFIVVGLLVAYLLFVVGRMILPRLRSIGKAYNSAILVEPTGGVLRLSDRLAGAPRQPA